METHKHPILLFDGVCNVCDSSINFIIKRDKEGKYRYASLQSETGQELLKKFNLPTNDFDSFVYVDGDSYYTKSSGALKVLKGLGGLWSIFYAFIIIPKPIRDAVYSLIAQNRYKWFGKKDECMIPSPEIRERFYN